MVNSGTSNPKSSTASTPKMAGKYAKDGLYVAKGEYGEHAKEAAFIKEGDNEPLTTKG